MTFVHIDWCASEGYYGDLDCSCPETEREEFLLENSINLGDLTDQIEFSTNTFGPGPRLKGVLDHIRKELVEVEENPTDLSEWVDVVILAFDGAWRAGYSAEDIIKQYKTKMKKNKARDWPDWRTADPDKAIEHVRS